MRMLREETEREKEGRNETCVYNLVDLIEEWEKRDPLLFDYKIVYFIMFLIMNALTHINSRESFYWW